MDDLLFKFEPTSDGDKRFRKLLGPDVGLKFGFSSVDLSSIRVLFNFNSAGTST